MRNSMRSKIIRGTRKGSKARRELTAEILTFRDNACRTVGYNFPGIYRTKQKITQNISTKVS